VCRGTSALTCLLQQLTAAEASSPGTFAASRALAGLAANQANQGDAIKVSHHVYVLQHIFVKSLQSCVLVSACSNLK